MMPYCEYHKCKKVAEDRCKLLRMWDSYDFRTRPTHTQAIWLCAKHLKKINEILEIEPEAESL